MPLLHTHTSAPRRLDHVPRRRLAEVYFEDVALSAPTVGKSSSQARVTYLRPAPIKGREASD